MEFGGILNTVSRLEPDQRGGHKQTLSNMHSSSRPSVSSVLNEDCCFIPKLCSKSSQSLSCDMYARMEYVLNLLKVIEDMPTCMR